MDGKVTDRLKVVGKILEVLIARNILSESNTRSKWQEELVGKSVMHVEGRYGNRTEPRTAPEG